MKENERIPGLSAQDQERLDEEFKQRWQMDKINYPPDPDKAMEEHNPSIGSMVDRENAERQLKLTRRELADEVRNWMAQHPDYILKKVFSDIKIKPDAGADDLPLEFVDHLIDLADHKWNLFDILRQTASVKIYPYGGTIALGLKDSKGHTLAQLYFDAKPPFKFREVGSTMPK